MKRKISKIILWLAGVIFIILAILYFLGLYGYRIQNYFITQRQEKMLAELRVEYSRIEEAQKNDNYGGKTPEETLDLYVKALEKGDIELASKYYEISPERPNLQDEEIKSLRGVMERDGSLNLVVEEIKKTKDLGTKKVWPDGDVSFVYDFITEKEITSTSIVSTEEIITIIPKGTRLSVGEALRINPYTKVWKIIQ